MAMDGIFLNVMSNDGRRKKMKNEKGQTGEN